MKTGRRHARSALAAAAIALSTSPALAEPPRAPPPAAVPAPVPPIVWEPGMPPPPGYRVGSEVRLPFVISGAVLHFATWTPMVILGSVLLSDRDNSPTERTADAQLLVPVVGPLLTMVRYSGMFPGAWKAVLVADEIGQIAGLTLMTIGLVWQKPALQREPRKRDQWRPNFSMPVPLLFHGGGVGLGLAGTM